MMESTSNKLPKVAPATPTTPCFCLGLQAQSERSLTEEEKDRLNLERRQLLGQAMAYALAVPLGLPVGLLLTAWMYSVLGRGTTTTVIVLIFLFVGLMASAIGPLAARDAWRRRGAAAMDLQGNQVLRFSGSIDLGSDVGASSERVFAMMRAGLVGLGTDEVSFEVLVPSGRLWSVGGKAPPVNLVVPIVYTAPMPEHARIAAEWVRPMTTEGLSDLHSGQRPLTKQEIQELLTHERACFQGPLNQVLLFGVWVLAYFFARRFFTLETVWFHVQGMVASLLFFRAAWKLSDGVRSARAFGGDRVMGAVQILRAQKHKAASVRLSLSPAVEVLPCSGLVWTAAGEPAAWRRKGHEMVRET